MESPPLNLHGARRIEQHPLLGAPAQFETITFTFENHLIEARHGETLIAALLAAGIRVLRTMPKTGDARGGFCLVGRCSDCLVIVDGSPNTLACQTMAAEGTCVSIQRGQGEWREGPA